LGGTPDARSECSPLFPLGLGKAGGPQRCSASKGRARGEPESWGAALLNTVLLSYRTASLPSGDSFAGGCMS